MVFTQPQIFLCDFRFSKEKKQIVLIFVVVSIYHFDKYRPVYSININYRSPIQISFLWVRLIVRGFDWSFAASGILVILFLLHANMILRLNKSEKDSYGFPISNVPRLSYSYFNEIRPVQLLCNRH